MKNTKSALLVGVGGQGAILTAKVLVNGLMKAGYDVKMSEVHGMSQRGGSVSTQVHWGEKVNSPVIGKGAADIIVAFEKMEAVRYADFLKPDGIAVINDYEIASSSIAAGLCEYPDGCLEAMQQHFRCYVLNAAEIAESLGSAKCMNIVLFGSMAKAGAASSLETFAPTLDATPAIGPERLSIMFIMSDSLNTDSKLIFCFHLQFEIEAENDRRREAVTRGTLARSPG